MGDFYELFFDDALTAAEALRPHAPPRATRTSPTRSRCAACHAAQTYVARCSTSGTRWRSASSGRLPAKGIVRRGVVRVLTLRWCSTATARRAGQPVSRRVPICRLKTRRCRAWAIAAYDLTTGEPSARRCRRAQPARRTRPWLDVRELLCRATRRRPRAREGAAARVRRGAPAMTASRPSRALTRCCPGVQARSRALARGPSPPRWLLRYAVASQPGHSLPVQRVGRLDPKDHLHLDERRRRPTSSSSARCARGRGLLAHLDATITLMGARRLRTWIAFPSRARRASLTITTRSTRSSPPRAPRRRPAGGSATCPTSSASRSARRWAPPCRATSRPARRPRRVPAIMDALARQDIADALKPVQAERHVAPTSTSSRGLLVDAPPGASRRRWCLPARASTRARPASPPLRANGRETILARWRSGKNRQDRLPQVKYNGVFGTTSGHQGQPPRRPEGLPPASRPSPPAALRHRGAHHPGAPRSWRPGRRFGSWSRRASKSSRGWPRPRRRLSRLAGALADLDALASFAETAQNATTCARRWTTAW